MVGRAQEAHEICAVGPRRHRPSLRSCCGRLFREVEKNVCLLHDGELHEDGSGDRVLQQEPRGHVVASGEEMDGGGADAEYYMDHRGGAADRESGEIRGRRRRTDLPRLWRGAVHISDRAQEGRRGSVPDYVAFRQDEHLPEAYPLSHPARRMDPFSLAPVRTPYPSRPLAPPREVAAHDAGANVEVGTAEGCEARRCGGDGEGPRDGKSGRDPRQPALHGRRPLLRSSDRRRGRMDWPPLRTPVNARVSDTWIRRAIEQFPAAACFASDFWPTTLPPCEGHGKTGYCGIPKVAMLAEYIRNGIIRPADDHKPHVCGALFALPCGRLIFHPRQLNDITTPPPLSLPSPRYVAELVRDCDVLVKSDYSMWFYQLRLPEGARGWFAFHAEDEDGTARLYEMAAVPMGWSASTAAADAVARTLVGVGSDERWCDPRIGVAIYVDDILFTKFDEACRFRARCAGAGALLKIFQTTVRGVCVYVGIDIRVPGGDFRASSRLREKMRLALDEFERDPTTERGEKLAGLLVAVLERQGVCLAAGRAVWAATSPGGTERARGRTGPVLADSERRALLQITEGSWRRVVAPGKTCVGASDASSSGWGWVWLDEAGPRWGKGTWQSRSTPHINFLELIAVLRAVRQSPPGSRLRLWVDNNVTVEWLRRGTSRTRFACELLVRIEDVLHARGCTLEAAYIDTDANIADPLSRGADEPKSVPLPEWSSTWQRRVLGWSTAVGDGAGAEEVAAVANEGEHEDMLWTESLNELDTWEDEAECCFGRDIAA